MNDSLRYDELVNQGITLMQVQNYSKAKDMFLQATEVDKNNKTAYMHLGNACANLDEFEEAKTAFEKVLLIDPDDGEAYFNIGNIYVLQDDLYKCVENYNKAEEKGFRRIELYSNLAGIFRELGDTTQAVRNLNKAIKVAPLRGDVRVEKAHIYISEGKFQEALETLEELQQILPDAFEAYDLQSQIYCGMKQYDKALEIIDGALEKFEKDVVLQWIRIKILVEKQDFDEAKKAISKIKEMEDYDTVEREVIFQESIVFSYENKIDAAIASLEQLLDKEQETEGIDEQTRYLLMNLYLGQKDYDKSLEQAKKLSSAKTDTLYNISGMYYEAHILKQKGKQEEAKAKYKDTVTYLRKLSIKIPTFYEIYVYRLLCHKELGEYEKALELADYIENLYPEKADAYAMRCVVYSDMGMEEKAEEQRQKAKAINPNLVI